MKTICPQSRTTKFLITIFVLMICSPLFADIKTEKSHVSKKLKGFTDLIISDLAKRRDIKTKNVIAINNLTNNSENSKKESIGEAVSEIISYNLNRDKRLIVIERGQVAKLLKEIELGMTGLVDERTAKKAGRMVSADYILFGEINELGNDFIITARLVDVETAKIAVNKKIEISKKYLIPVANTVGLETRNPVYAGLFSAVIPGWGQLYNNQNLKGFVFLGLDLVAIGSLATFRILSGKSRKKYDDATNASDAEKHYDDWDKYNSYGNYSLIAYGVIWACGIADAIISSKMINNRIEQYRTAFYIDVKQDYLASSTVYYAGWKLRF